MLKYLLVPAWGFALGQAINKCRFIQWENGTSIYIYIFFGFQHIIVDQSVKRECKNCKMIHITIIINTNIVKLSHSGTCGIRDVVEYLVKVGPHMYVCVHCGWRCMCQQVSLLVCLCFCASMFVFAFAYICIYIYMFAIFAINQKLQKRCTAAAKWICVVCVMLIERRAALRVPLMNLHFN